MLQLRQNRPPRFKAPKQPGSGERGFVLLAVLFMLLLVVLALSVAAPKMAMELKREKETETIHRGMEYARAIRMYYRQFGRYPNSIDQLVKTGNQHFLRKRYLDPLTGKDDWRLIRLGQAQTMGTGAAGSPAAGANGQNGGGTPGSAPSTAGSTGMGSAGTGSAGMGGGPASNSGFSLGNSGSPGAPASGSSGFSLGNPTSSGNSGVGGSSGVSNSNSGASSTGAPGAANGNGIGSFGNFGQDVGGAPIVGVGLPVDKPSLKVFRKKDHYNQWEFVYDPNQDLGGAMGQTGTGVPQQPGASNGINGTNGPSNGQSNGPSNGMNNGFGGNSSQGGFSLGNSGFGNSGSSGSSGNSQ